MLAGRTREKVLEEIRVRPTQRHYRSRQDLLFEVFASFESGDRATRHWIEESKVYSRGSAEVIRWIPKRRRVGGSQPVRAVSTSSCVCLES